MGWSKFNYRELMYCASITSPPCPPNDITISCKGSSHYPSCSTNGRDISACLFQPTRNTDPIQTANRSSCCCHGNSIHPPSSHGAHHSIASLGQGRRYLKGRIPATVYYDQHCRPLLSQYEPSTSVRIVHKLQWY